jgi:flagellar operon protein
MNVRATAGLPAAAQRRQTIDVAPGFGDSLDRLVDTPKPANSAPTGAPSGLQISRHAQSRMESRGIALDEQDVAEINGALDALTRRGAKESLILLDDKAFIVGVPDRKLITAMTRREAVGNVFSQIDSTVVIR